MGNVNIQPNMRAALNAGEPFEELLDPADDQDYYGAVRAFDPATGELIWQHQMNDITWAGVLSTASDLVFSGGREGYFYALDAATGELLWRISLGGQINSGPMTYAGGWPAVRRRRRRNLAVCVRTRRWRQLIFTRLSPDGKG